MTIAAKISDNMGKLREFRGAQTNPQKLSPEHTTVADKHAPIRVLRILSDVFNMKIAVKLCEKATVGGAHVGTAQGETTSSQAMMRRQMLFTCAQGKPIASA